MNPEQAARAIARDTTMDLITASACVNLALRITSPDRAEDLVRQADNLRFPGGALAALGMLATGGIPLPLTGRQLREAADVLITTVWQQAYDKGVQAAIDAGIAIDHRPPATRRAEEIAAMETASDVLAATLGKPEGHRYNGGRVDFDTGRSVVPRE